VKRYTTTFEADGDRPYGLGCGGTVHLLLERRATAAPFLNALQRAFSVRQAIACSLVLEGEHTGSRCMLLAEDAPSPLSEDSMLEAAREAWLNRESFLDGDSMWAEYIPPRCGLFIFGAGDDAKPLVTQARTLGWHIAVADGRAHLATRTRFPEADEVKVLRHGQEGFADLTLIASDAAVVMTHSYQQDIHILRQLLPLQLAYIGVLGPRYRTADLLKDLGLDLGAPATRWMHPIHAPVGLDLGGDSPATIALSILAEIQGTLSQRRPRTVSNVQFGTA
jgi:xanthine dehydrogenase accessory factor